MLVPESSRLTDVGLDADAIEKARLAASRQLREAIGARYLCPPDLASFPATGEGAELRALVEQHGVALAVLALSQHDGGRGRKVDSEAQDARNWLGDVKAGRVDLSSVLPRRSQQNSPLRQVITVDGGDTELRDEYWPGPPGRLRFGKTYLC